jgi:hypothetical protein
MSTNASSAGGLPQADGRADIGCPPPSWVTEPRRRVRRGPQVNSNSVRGGPGGARAVPTLRGPWAGLEGGPAS